MTYPDYIDEIIQRLEKSGECAYIVGGSLRDIMLGLEPHDYDIATSALPQKTSVLFSDMHVIETGLKHGTVTVVYKGFPVEITTFRIDGSYTDARHPDSVRFTDNISLDLSRRDFTVNAMAYNKVRGLVDPFCGQTDIEKKILRAVGKPTDRFKEDALRIMRAFRFSAQLGFSIDTDTLDGVMETAHGLSLIARERIGSEFLRLITSSDPFDALIMMEKYGAWQYALGEYRPNDLVLKALCKMPATVTARMGLLLCQADEKTARDILHSLRCSGKQTTGALATARGTCMKTVTQVDARHLLASVGIYACDAALASELLGISPTGAYALTERQKNTPCSIHDLKINGKDIAKMGASGKMIGETLSKLLLSVIEEPELNERQTLLRLADTIIKESKGN